MKGRELGKLLNEEQLKEIFHIVEPLKEKFKILISELEELIKLYETKLDKGRSK